MINAGARENLAVFSLYVSSTIAQHLDCIRVTPLYSLAVNAHLWGFRRSTNAFGKSSSSRSLRGMEKQGSLGLGCH